MSYERFDMKRRRWLSLTIFSCIAVVSTSLSAPSAFAEECQTNTYAWESGQERYRDLPSYFFGITEDFTTFEIYSKDNVIVSATSLTASGTRRSYMTSDTFRGEGKNLVKTISGDSFVGVSWSLRVCGQTIPAPPACSSGESVVSSVTLTTSANPVAPGSLITVSGAVFSSGGCTIAGKTVLLRFYSKRWRHYLQTTWVTTDSNGRFAHTYRPYRPTSIYAYSDGVRAPRIYQSVSR